ncbi:MAG: methylcobamide--CoM methyltransferase [Clostridia bacterium]|nr:methylcobamide--CoM methyltransferase [Clostridia bacterium]
MNAKERLFSILNKESVDRPSCICPGGMMNMITTGLMEQSGVFLPTAHTDARAMAYLAKTAYTSGCFENVGVPFCMTVEAESMGAKVNMGTEAIEPHVSEYVLTTTSDWASLPSAEVHSGRSGVVLDAIELLRAELPDVPIIGNLTGPVSTASSLIEPTIFFKELRKKNADAHALMTHVTDHLIAFGLAQIEAGADIITISDPSGTGEILGPKYFEEFTVTYLNRLIEPLKAAGAKVIVHICGSMRQVYPQADQIISDVLSFDSIVPIREARQALPERLLMGNISTYTLEFGEPEKVRILTDFAADNGFDIISPACGLGMRSPLANIRTMLEVLKEREE